MGGGRRVMAITLDPQTGKITFGVVADQTNDAIAIDLASQFGVSEDFNDDYSSDNWTDVGTGFGVDVPNTVMDVRGVKGGTNNGSGFDLGAGNVSDTNFVLRFKIEFTSLPTIVTDDSALYLSIDSIDQSTGANTVGHDSLTLQIAKSATTQNTRLVPFHSDGGAVIETVGTALLVNGIGPIYYVEIKRTSTTSATWTLFSDSTYTAVIATVTEVIPASMTGLRHIVWRSRSDGSAGAGEITAEIDDVQFWNAKSVPILSSTTNWRIRYKLDYTVVNDSGSAINAGLFIGLSDKDAIAGSATAQDGFFLLTALDNAGNTKFRVQTPDNQTPDGTTDDSIFTVIPSVAIRFIEMIRDSASQTTVSIYSDSTFTTLTETQVQAGVSGSDNLKYLKLFNSALSISPNTLDGTFDDLTFTDLGAPVVAPTKTFAVNAIVKATTDEEFFVDSCLRLTIDETFTINATLVGRACSPWLNFANGDGSTQRLTRNGGQGQAIEFPQVNVDTFVTGFKIRLQRVGGASGSFNCKIFTYPPSQDAQGTIPVVGTSVNISGASIPSSLTETTAVFSPPVKLVPNQRYMIGFSEGFDSGTGINYETRVTQATQFQYSFQDPNSGSPPLWINLLTTDRQIAGDILVLNGDASLCFTVNAILTKITAWQFREQRIRNDQGPSGGGPVITFSEEPPRFKIDSTIGSIGFGWVFKTFLLSEITGSTIKADWAGTGTAQIRVYDGRYERTNFGDFIPNEAPTSDNPVATTVLKGAGLLGDIETIAPSSTTTLDGASINYAGALLDEVTVFIKLKDDSNSVAGNLNIASITVTGNVSVFNFNFPYTSPLTSVAPDTWVTTDPGRINSPNVGSAGFMMVKNGSNSTIAQDFSVPALLGTTLGTSWRFRTAISFSNLALTPTGSPNDGHFCVTDEDQTVNCIKDSANSIGVRFRNETSGKTVALYKKVGTTVTASTIPAFAFTTALTHVEVTRNGNTADIRIYSNATFTTVIASLLGIDVSDVPIGQDFVKWGNDSLNVLLVSAMTGTVSLIEISSSSGAGSSTIVEENTGTEFDWGFVDASSITEPSVDFEFTVDACIGIFASRRSDIGALIVKVLVANPAGLTGLQILDEVRLLRETSKTSRIKNWIGFLRNRGIIVDDGSSPDWYKTVWTVV